jgi:hypothetical protein
MPPKLPLTDGRHRMVAWSCDQHREKITHCILAERRRENKFFRKYFCWCSNEPHAFCLRDIEECFAMTSELVDDVPHNDLDPNLRSPLDSGEVLNNGDNTASLIATSTMENCAREVEEYLLNDEKYCHHRHDPSTRSLARFSGQHYYCP